MKLQGCHEDPNSRVGVPSYRAMKPNRRGKLNVAPKKQPEASKRQDEGLCLKCATGETLAKTQKTLTGSEHRNTQEKRRENDARQNDQ